MRSYVRRIVPLGLALVALVSGAARADTVKMKNGDTLTGKVLSAAEGKLVFKSDSAGELKLDLAQIDSLTTDDSITLDMKDGTKMSGKIASGKDGNVTVEGFGSKSEIALGSVAAVNKPPRHWTGSLLAAATWSTGNTETSNVNVDAHAENRGDIDRITLDGWYRTTRTKDQTTGDTSTSERKEGGKGQYDYFFGPPKLYGYGNALGEADAAASLDFRAILGVGLGYQFFDTADFKLAGEGGVAWIYENFSDGTDTNSDPALRVAGHLVYEFSPKVHLFDDLDVYKVLDGEDWLVHNKGGLREQITGSFFAAQWVEHTWNTSPAASAKQLDTVYYVGVGWTF